MKKTYRRMLLNELRMFPVATNDIKECSNKSLTEAVTFAEKINHELGMLVNPEDILFLACQAKDLEKLFKQLKNATDEKLINKTKPFYPDFPKTVMKIDEAQFRFHQYIHYFSTYGLFELGYVVEKGWLPNDSDLVSDTKKTKSDTSLLASKVVHFIDEKDMYMIPVAQIITKRNRATSTEVDILKEAIVQLNDSQLLEVTKKDIPFKENLKLIFYTIFTGLNNTNQATTLEALHNLCQHTGDVFKCMYYILGKEKYKLSTAQRKLLVHLLESYPAYDLQSNILISRKKSKNNGLILNYISYNKFSRSEAHQQIVNSFRDGKLHSWNSRMEYLLVNDRDRAMTFIKEKPGMMLRMLVRLLKLGYDKTLLENILVENCQNLSLQTVITIMNEFDRILQGECESVYENAYNILENIMKEIMKNKNPIPCLYNKKVYIDEFIYDFDRSFIDFSNKDGNGGYLRRGITIKIPKDVKRMRFFIYWNDKKCVDIDLHAYGITKEGRSVYIGWNGDFNSHDIMTSGDITHSDAAEYIDVDLEKTDIEMINAYFNIYSGKKYFSEVSEVFAGALGVDKLGKSVQLYNAKNCFMKHDLKSKNKMIHYAIIDIPNRLIYITDKKSDNYCKLNRPTVNRSNLSNYLSLLLEGQNSQIVSDPDEADTILCLDKPFETNEYSLIDNNYFADC